MISKTDGSSGTDDMQKKQDTGLRALVQQLKIADVCVCVCARLCSWGGVGMLVWVCALPGWFALVVCLPVCIPVWSGRLYSDLRA